ncbi:hypothetical protein DdX_10915 [Ditylenchus destructor]|uniref:Uncharacterized protein n=1 Tax=Ditylenchus destructor TaxID=166010 RepID=A0AAD4MYH4_9BILA|nr:hypothetical protein DdX_10915 [Ditylenchus destructor]
MFRYIVMFAIVVMGANDSEGVSKKDTKWLETHQHGAIVECSVIGPSSTNVGPRGLFPEAHEQPLTYNEQWSIETSAVVNVHELYGDKTTVHLGVNFAPPSHPHDDQQTTVIVLMDKVHNRKCQIPILKKACGRGCKILPNIALQDPKLRNKIKYSFSTDEHETQGNAESPKPVDAQVKAGTPNKTEHQSKTGTQNAANIPGETESMNTTNNQTEPAGVPVSKVDLEAQCQDLPKETEEKRSQGPSI